MELMDSLAHWEGDCFCGYVALQECPCDVRRTSSPSVRCACDPVRTGRRVRTATTADSKSTPWAAASPYLVVDPHIRAHEHDRRRDAMLSRVRCPSDGSSNNKVTVTGRRPPPPTVVRRQGSCNKEWQHGSARLRIKRPCATRNGRRFARDKIRRQCERGRTPPSEPS